MGDRYAQVSGTKEVQRRKEVTLHSNLIRWGTLAALSSGFLWITGGLLTLAYPQAPAEVTGTRRTAWEPRYSAPLVWACWEDSWDSTRAR